MTCCERQLQTSCPIDSTHCQWQQKLAALIFTNALLHCREPPYTVQSKWNLWQTFLRNQWDVQCLFCSSDILQSVIHVTRQCTAKCHKLLGVLQCSVMHNVPYNTIWNLLYNAICNVFYNTLCYAIHGNQSIQFWWRPGDHLEKLSTHCMYICIAFLYISIAFVLHFIFLYHICIAFVYICITFGHTDL